MVAWDTLVSVAYATRPDERPSSVEEKTSKPCRHIAHAGINRGWMPENYPSLPPGEKCFLLTSPLQELSLGLGFGDLKSEPGCPFSD